MLNAAKNKSLSLAGLMALRVLLLLVVALCLGQTRVWGFAVTPQHESGVFESVTPSSIREIYDASPYDASDSLLAAKAGPYRGGPHSQTQKPWGDGLESHHMPAKSVSGLGEPNGPAIQMTPADHARTMSNGKMQGSGEYREMIGDMISGGDMRGAMATEIRDVRRVAREAGDPRRYNGAMREMMDYSRSQGYIPINPQTVVPRTR